MPRLSAVDQAFFLLETRDRPMSIGALFVLVPPPSARGDFADRLVRTMLKCPVGPPFNYRLKPGPVKGLLALVQDEQMDPAPQVHRHRLPRGTDLRGLFARLCPIHVQRCGGMRPCGRCTCSPAWPAGGLRSTSRRTTASSTGSASSAP